MHKTCPEIPAVSGHNPYKRLEKGKLKFPKINDAVMSLTNDQFSWLLSGLDYEKHPLLPEVFATNFY